MGNVNNELKDIDPRYIEFICRYHPVKYIGIATNGFGYHYTLFRRLRESSEDSWAATLNIFAKKWFGIDIHANMLDKDDEVPQWFTESCLT
jgi:uncharacterized membrane protein YhdT